MPPETARQFGCFLTPYAALNVVLTDFVHGARAALGDRFAGAYLQGSFAVGDFDEHSDVDFLVATTSEPSDAQLAELQSMHQRIYDTSGVEWGKHLEGSYVPLDILRRCVPPRVPLAYLDNGSRVIERSDHDNTLVVRWVVRERGIILSGPDPRELIDPVPPDELRREVRQTMRVWGDSIVSGSADVRTRWGQPYTVISYCRMLHTLETAMVGSKRAGAAWALRSLDRRWSGLIERAWGERPDPWRKVRESADPKEVEETTAFVRYAIESIQRHGA